MRAAPAQIALAPITAYAGTLHDAAREIVHQHGHSGQLVKRARDYDTRRKRGEPLTISSPPSLLSEPPHDYVCAEPSYERDQRKNVRTPPQPRPGWRPGQLEWSNHRGRVLRVS